MTLWQIHHAYLAADLKQMLANVWRNHSRSWLILIYVVGPCIPALLVVIPTAIFGLVRGGELLSQPLNMAALIILGALPVAVNQVTRSWRQQHFLETHALSFALPAGHWWLLQLALQVQLHLFEAILVLVTLLLMLASGATAVQLALWAIPLLAYLLLVWCGGLIFSKAALPWPMALALQLVLVALLFSQQILWALLLGLSHALLLFGLNRWRITNANLKLPLWLSIALHNHGLSLLGAATAATLIESRWGLATAHATLFMLWQYSVNGFCCWCLSVYRKNYRAFYPSVNHLPYGQTLLRKTLCLGFLPALAAPFIALISLRHESAGIFVLPIVALAAGVLAEFRAPSYRLTTQIAPMILSLVVMLSR